MKNGWRYRLLFNIWVKICTHKSNYVENDAKLFLRTSVPLTLPVGVQEKSFASLSTYIIFLCMWILTQILNNRRYYHPFFIYKYNLKKSVRHNLGCGPQYIHEDNKCIVHVVTGLLSSVHGKHPFFIPISYNSKRCCACQGRNHANWGESEMRSRTAGG